MVITGSQFTALFDEIFYVEILHETRIKLQEEGIRDIDNLVNFDKDTLEQVADNLQHPGGHVPDPYCGATRGSTILNPPFFFRAKSQMRLLLVYDLMRYYGMMGQGATPGSI